VTRDTRDAEARDAARFAAVVDGAVDRSATVRLRPYDPDREGDPAALWACKRAFERELGGVDGDQGGRDDGVDGDDRDDTTGGVEKADAYDAKLTAAYRERYLAWVERCVADEPVVWLALSGAAEGANEGAEQAEETLGYAFLLPERLAMVWDGAVLNELYVRPLARGSGVADALLGAVVERAREQSLPMDRLLLDVDPSNERARAFYRRHDFRPWGETIARKL